MAAKTAKKPSVLSNLFKPGNVFGKGGIVGKALTGVANVAVSKVTGGLITNLFQTTPAKTAEQQRTTANATAVLAGIGSGVGTMKALYQPSQQTIQREAMAGSAPFSAQNAGATMNVAGTKSFLAQFWMPIAVVFGLIVLLIFKKK